MLAAYAAILATITAVIQTINFFRDRRRIKISTRRETEYFEVDGVGGAGETVTLVIVANAGRRPVTITNVGARSLFPKVGFVNLVCGPKVPVELTEGKQLLALADEELIDLTEVGAWEAHDAVGHAYRMNVAPWSTRMWSHLRSNWAKRKRAHR
jgi:hypothetical protein